MENKEYNIFGDFHDYICARFSCATKIITTCECEHFSTALTVVQFAHSSCYCIWNYNAVPYTCVNTEWSQKNDDEHIDDGNDNDDDHNGDDKQWIYIQNEIIILNENFSYAIYRAIYSASNAAEICHQSRIDTIRINGIRIIQKYKNTKIRTCFIFFLVWFCESHETRNSIHQHKQTAK